MEFCPHGARIVIEDGQVTVFVDECATCQELLETVQRPDRPVPIVA